jgi:sarcosine oxidase/L-pipecolate oxidase
LGAKLTPVSHFIFRQKFRIAPLYSIFTMPDSYIVIGAGAFGSSTALELARAGHAVTVLERSANGYHSPDAASNDLNKIIRADYSDEHYRDLAKSTISIWRRCPILSPFYHETGVLLWSGKAPTTSALHREYVRDGVSRAAGSKIEITPLELAKNGESLPPLAFAVSKKKDLLRCFPAALQAKVGHLQELIEAGTLQAYMNPRGGWAEADRATRAILDEAKKLGVKVYGQSQVVELLYNTTPQPTKVVGVRTSNGTEHRTEGDGQVIVCSGAWTSGLLRDLLAHRNEPYLIPAWASAQCVVAIQLDEEQRRIHKEAPVVLDFTT